MSVESVFVRGNERWNGSDIYGRTVLPVHSPFKQSLEISSPSKEAVYLLAPGELLTPIKNPFTYLKPITIKLRKYCRKVSRRPAFQLQPWFDLQTEHRWKQPRSNYQRHHSRGRCRSSRHSSDIRTRKHIAIWHGKYFAARYILGQRFQNVSVCSAFFEFRFFKALFLNLQLD